MKHALAILCLGLFLTACSRQDAKLLCKQGAAPWTSSDRHATAVFSPDGSYSVTTRSVSTNSIAGTWVIRDGMLTTTITNAPDIAHALIGQIHQYTITHLDDHRLDLERINPHATISYSR
jgi:hypothetical protein